MTTGKWIVVCVLTGFLGICIWEIIKLSIDYRKLCKEEKRLQEERRRVKEREEERKQREKEREEERKQREALINKIEIALNERTEIIAQLLENLSREHSDDSGDDNPSYGDTEVFEMLQTKGGELSNFLLKNFNPYTAIIITGTEVKIVCTEYSVPCSCYPTRL